MSACVSMHIHGHIHGHIYGHIHGHIHGHTHRYSIAEGTFTLCAIIVLECTIVATHSDSNTLCNGRYILCSDSYTMCIESNILG